VLAVLELDEAVLAGLELDEDVLAGSELDEAVLEGESEIAFASAVGSVLSIWVALPEQAVMPIKASAVTNMSILFFNRFPLFDKVLTMGISIPHQAKNSNRIMVSLATTLGND
jgi:hypothetical protein